MMPRYFDVVESRHELQNPTSPEKIRLLGEWLQLGPDSRVLDVGSGRGGPAILLARTFGCRITCIEKAEGFDAAARERARDAGVDALLEFVHADAADVPLEPGSFDVILCLGSAFIWSNLAGTLAALAPAARSFVAVGEPYWRSWPVPDTVDPEWRGEFMTLRGNVDAFEAAGLAPVTIIDASPDDWDRYETLHWLVAEEWLRDHPTDPDAESIRTQVNVERDRYLRWQRDLLGWSIIVGRKN